MITIVEQYDRDLNSPLNIMKNIKEKKKTEADQSSALNLFSNTIIYGSKIVFINLNILKILP